MAFTSDEARRRVLDIRALFSRIFSSGSRRVLQKLPPELTDRLARDIGVSPYDLAVQRHVWPSETHRHPRL